MAKQTESAQNMCHLHVLRALDKMRCLDMDVDRAAQCDCLAITCKLMEVKHGIEPNAKGTIDTEVLQRNHD